MNSLPRNRQGSFAQLNPINIAGTDEIERGDAGVEQTSAISTEDIAPSTTQSCSSHVERTITRPRDGVAPLSSGTGRELGGLLPTKLQMMLQSVNRNFIKGWMSLDNDQMKCMWEIQECLEDLNYVDIRDFEKKWLSKYCDKEK